MGRIFVVGLGPGDEETMTIKAQQALSKSDVIIGYRAYTDLVKERFADKEIIESPMRGEIDRCRKCVELARSGRTVSLICSGDAGMYGMASPLLEIASAEGFSDVEIIPGVTAALSGSALLGAPVGHDMCTISLSDLLTPWDVIEKRLRCAAEADFCIVIYNPASSKRTDHLRRACEILMSVYPKDRPCGLARNIGRDGESAGICTLGELADHDVDMFTTVFVGNSSTYVSGGRLITPRGYDKK